MECPYRLPIKKMVLMFYNLEHIFHNLEQLFHYMEHQGQPYYQQ